MKSDTNNNSIIQKLSPMRKVAIEAVMAITGWDAEYAKQQISSVAKKLNTTWTAYAKNELWYLDENDSPASLGAAKRTAAKRKEYIAKVREATGWDEAKTRAALAKARSYGMNGYYYCLYAAWNLSDEEIAKQAKVIAERKEQRQKTEDWYIDTCVKKSGKSREEIVAHMKELKAMGINTHKYTTFECFNFTPEQIEAFAVRAKEEQEKSDNTTRKYLQKICDATGWSEAKVKMEVSRAKLACGASYEDYYVFRLYEQPYEAHAQYVTFGLFSKMRAKYNDYGPSIKVLDDKAEFNRTFSDLINRRWFVNRNLSYEEFLKNIDGLDSVIVKPLAATQGKDVHKFSCKVEDKEALYKEIMSLRKSIVEEYIIQHPDVMAFCDTSVNTIRITTLNANGKCNFLYSVFRMGRGNVVDNFHAGGIAAAVDMRTGVVITHAADLEANVFPTNPYSGLAMRGFQIPHWDKIIDICKQAYNRVPGANLIGWDFAITPDGVDLIEGNPGASYVVAQIPFVQHHVGLRDVMVDPYM